jgi:hypothetical protein
LLLLLFIRSCLVPFLLLQLAAMLLPSPPCDTTYAITCACCGIPPPTLPLLLLLLPAAEH